MKKISHFIIPVFAGLFSCLSISAQMRVRAPSANWPRARTFQRAHAPTIMAPPNNNGEIQNTRGNQPCCSQVTVVHVAPAPHASAGNWQSVNNGNFEGENTVPGLGFDIPHLAAITRQFPFNPAFQPGTFRPIVFVQNPEFQGVPGLGFDIPHLAAISGNTHFNPEFEHDRFGRNDVSFAPIFWSDIPGYADFIDSTAIQSAQHEVQQPGQQQPQIVVIQQAAAPAREQELGRDPQAVSGSPSHSNAAPNATPAAAPTIRDVGEFVFVRRDGRILFASAFYVSGGVLQFVTPDGVRRTVPVTELDADATRKMNETLGTTVDLHK
jgi:hypothetical protein